MLTPPKPGCGSVANPTMEKTMISEEGQSDATQADETAGEAVKVTAQNFISVVAGASKANTQTAIIALLGDLDADALGFAEDEAEDFDTFVTQFVEYLEAGDTFTVALEKAGGNFVATEKSQLWQEWTNVLSQGASIFDGWAKAFESAITAL